MREKYIKKYKITKSELKNINIQKEFSELELLEKNNLGDLVWAHDKALKLILFEIRFKDLEANYIYSENVYEEHGYYKKRIKYYWKGKKYSSAFKESKNFGDYCGYISTKELNNYLRVKDSKLFDGFRVYKYHWNTLKAIFCGTPPGGIITGIIGGAEFVLCKFGN